MSYLGIDPGWSGGIATIEKLPSGGRRTSVWRMPESDIGIAILSRKLARLGIKRAVLESVNCRPGEAQTNVWKFAANFFGWRMALLMAEIDYDLVIPQTWQKAFGLIVPGISKLNGKEYEKARRAKKHLNAAEARRIFPSIKVTLLNCDALLIARYAQLLDEPARKYG